MDDLKILPDGRMTTNSAAQYLGFSPGALNNYRVLGGGPEFVKVRGRVFYYQADLDKWLESFGTSKTTAQARIKAAWMKD